jgi:hypothetical protein
VFWFFKFVESPNRRFGETCHLKGDRESESKTGRQAQRFKLVSCFGLFLKLEDRGGNVPPKRLFISSAGYMALYSETLLAACSCSPFLQFHLNGTVGWGSDGDGGGGGGMTSPEMSGYLL